MTPDLTLLVWAVVLAFLQIVVAAVGTNTQVPLSVLAGNREGMPEATGWAGRAARAHRNMMESLPLFAALVLIAHVAGRVNGTAILGEQIFVWARLAHAAIYTVGLPWIRTVAWAVSVVGMGMILMQLV
jgi:uncharacterized MAPEG superfamily protein